MSNQKSYKNVTVRVSGAFLIFIAAAYVMAGRRAFFSAAAAVLAHEGGHLLAMLLTGGEPARISMEAPGLCIDAGEEGNERLAAAAGPLAGLLLAVLAPGETGRISLALSLFNLLPYSKLDGGRLLAGRVSGRTALLLDCAAVLLMLLLGMVSRGAAAAGLWLFVDFISELL